VKGLALSPFLIESLTFFSNFVGCFWPFYWRFGLFWKNKSGTRVSVWMVATAFDYCCLFEFITWAALLICIDRVTFGFCWYISIGQNSWFTLISRCLQNAVMFLTYADNLRTNQPNQGSYLASCSNASRCIFINKQTRWTVEHMSAFAAAAKASSLIRLGKNHSKMLKEVTTEMPGQTQFK